MVDPNLLVGIDTGDDAAVYRISDELALVLTVDFFPPILDDPYTYGAVAAANSLSDIYAMGARPVLALNIVAFPIDHPPDVLQEILRGGAEKVLEAGALIVGGHTIDDAEPKYGLAVTGFVTPGQHLTIAGAKPGDLLVLTKPIGAGIITTAAKLDQAGEAVLQEAIRHMTALNKEACAAALEVGVNACTDVSGFGLLGHLHGMAQASGVGARLFYPRVPLMRGAWALAAEQGISPSGTDRNRKYYDHAVAWDQGLHPQAYRILYDPQTSGGLLASVPRGRAEALLAALARRGVEHAAVVGEITDDGRGSIQVAG